MSRQSEHLQRVTLKRLQDMVPSECPLLVERRTRAEGGGFAVRGLISATPFYQGRFQCVAAWIDGYVTGWDER